MTDARKPILTILGDPGAVACTDDSCEIPGSSIRSIIELAVDSSDEARKPEATSAKAAVN
jgi:hypothetical protein